MQKKLAVDIGVFAANEEANIEQALKSIQKSKLEFIKIHSIIVVSSGSYDHTNRIVRRFARLDKRIKLIDEAERHGKARAVNIFLSQATAPIMIMLSADLRVSNQAIEEIGLPFLNREVGMVGAHPVPHYSSKSRISREIDLLWQLHHEISLITPKCGEMVACRNVIRGIPVESAVDEATIEVLLKLIGYAVVYAPKAVVYNKGPLTVGEFLTQRRRVYTGHEWVYQKYQYKVVTMMPSKLFVVVARMLIMKPNTLIPMLRLILLELLARFLGYIDFHIFGKNPYVWKMIRR